MTKIEFTERPIDPSSIISEVMRRDCGGISVFIGTIRDRFEGKHVKKVHIEAYDVVAKTDLMKIIEGLKSTNDVREISFIHRIGELSVGDIVVAIAVSAPHRKDAFRVCRGIIDEMKQTTPIWKQEFFDDGSRWVEGESK